MTKHTRPPLLLNPCGLMRFAAILLLGALTLSWAGCSYEGGSFSGLRCLNEGEVSQGRQCQGGFWVEAADASMTLTDMNTEGDLPDMSSNSNTGPRCGNGILEGAEICDPQINDGMPGSCPKACAPQMGCFVGRLDGSPEQCNVQCLSDMVSACQNSDGCCPAGCNDSNDDDCPKAADCGNGKLDQGESCDKAIAAGNDGACPDSCQSPDACMPQQLVGSADNCSLRCESNTIAACRNDDGCCPGSCNANNDNDCMPVCGNGIKEDPETCDNMAMGADACPSTGDCNDQDACTADSRTGSSRDCDAVCHNDPITTCTGGDGCCPMGCNNGNDSDCMPVNLCGNGQIDGNEKCDDGAGTPKPCPAPSSCDDQDACTSDTRIGRASECTAECVFSTITMCTGGDGCCPMGCNNGNDSDCPAVNLCGNSTIDPGESCDTAIGRVQDGGCVGTCQLGSFPACINGTVLGADCGRSCEFSAETQCQNSDGCCPDGCNSGNDNDCSAGGSCGNGTLNPGEECDPGIASGAGSCPTSDADCNDRDACSIDIFHGNPDNCTAECFHPRIVWCANGDGCCPSSCDMTNDDDC